MNAQSFSGLVAIHSALNANRQISNETAAPNATIAVLSANAANGPRPSIPEAKGQYTNIRRVPSCKDRPKYYTMYVLDNASTVNVWEHYEKRDPLGVPGAYGSCFKAIEKATGQMRVVKSISKRNRDQNELQAFRKEIDTMKAMDHPNIIKFHNAYESQDELHIVMELCTGGDLFDEIEHLQRTKAIPVYNEQACSKILKQVLEAIRYMHERHVLHCDLKPDNLVYVSPPGNEHKGSGQLKVIDFGMARFWNARERERFSQVAGTPYYAAPEVVKKDYGPAADLWSIGVIMYIMLIGYPPFYASAEQYKKYYSDKLQAQEAANDAIKRKVIDGFQNVVKPGLGPWFPEERPISALARDLIGKLLESDVAARLTAREALGHPWIAGDASRDPLSHEVIRGLRQFDAKRKLQQHALNLMVGLLTDQEHQVLASTFAAMDKNGDNLITISEFREAMMLKDPSLGNDAVQEMFKSADLDGDGFICYHELVLASVHCKLIAREERLRNLFVQLDTNGDGKVTVDELASVLAIEQGEAAALIKDAKRVQRAARQQVAANGDDSGAIDYEEFLEMWRDNIHRQISAF